MVLSFAVARVRAPGLMEPGLFLQPAPMEDVNALVERFLSGAWPAPGSRLEWHAAAVTTAEALRRPGGAAQQRSFLLSQLCVSRDPV